MAETLIRSPEVKVAETEYRRLLGYPGRAEPSARAQELAAWARSWFDQHARPWIYLREASASIAGDLLLVDGAPFPSPQLRQHLLATEATRVVLLAVSAGAACEQHARRLWEESKPDEYFFLETYGSAVVERLVALANAKVCADADASGVAAIPHYSPGYSRWDVAEQSPLFDLICRGAGQDFPEALEVMPSGMLRPKKSLLGVIGLAPRSSRSAAAARAQPCAHCSYSPCNYRRMPYRHHTSGGRGTDIELPIRSLDNVDPTQRPSGPLTRGANYSTNRRALEKWSGERVQLTFEPSGVVIARFRFDGTTCTNMGRPLAFEYRATLGPAESAFPVLEATCQPCAGDTGYQSMCEYLRDAEGLMSAIAMPPSLVGRPLDEVLKLDLPVVSSGCYCDAASRDHKWRLALEAIHFALVQRTPAA